MEQPELLEFKVGNPREFVRIPGIDIAISKTPLHKELNWEGTHFALAKQGLFMPSPALFISYFCHVTKDCGDEIYNFEAYNAANEPLGKRERMSLYEHLNSPRNSVWLDAKFIEIQGVKYLVTDHYCVSQAKEDKLTPNTTIQLEPHLTESGFVNLKFNPQGLPIEKSKRTEYKESQNIFYIPPRNGAVARFGTGLDGFGLYCNGDPNDSDFSIGVFGCIKGTPKK